MTGKNQEKITTYKLVIIDPTEPSKIADILEDERKWKVEMFVQEARRWDWHYAFERRTTGKPNGIGDDVDGYYYDGSILKKYYHYYC